MAEKQKILIVDDDANIAELISLYLMKECYETMIVGDGEEALKVFPEFKPNLILLDLMLPGIDGYQVCRELRTSSQVPIIMLSAKGEIFDKVLGLELGADDYMIKPFDSKELVARVKAVLRRYQAAPAAISTEPKQQGEYVEYPDLIVNLTNYSVLYKGHSVEMPPKELELLYFLASSPNQVFTREQLLDHIWGYEYIGDTRTVDVHIKRLREKQKLSMDELSRLSGVSKSMLAQIERGDGNPTLSSLWKIANGMRVPFDALTARPKPDYQIIRLPDIQPILEDEGRVKNYSVFPDDEGRRFSVYYMELDPGSFWRSDPHVIGTIEFITLIRGALEIVAGEQTFTIHPGESIRFPGDAVHSYRNLNPGSTALHLIMYTP